MQNLFGWSSTPYCNFFYQKSDVKGTLRHYRRTAIFNELLDNKSTVLTRPGHGVNWERHEHNCLKHISHCSIPTLPLATPCPNRGVLSAASCISHVAVLWVMILLSFACVPLCRINTLPPEDGSFLVGTLNQELQTHKEFSTAKIQFRTLFNYLIACQWLFYKLSINHFLNICVERNGATFFLNITGVPLWN
jgi:hypothetical protein